MEIRLPNITGQSTNEQIAQFKSYLYQLVGDLNYALNQVEKAQSGQQAAVQFSGNQIDSSSQDAVDTFNKIKSLIIKSADIVEAYETILRREFDSSYVASSEFGEYKSLAHQEIVETAEGVQQNLQKIEMIESEISEIREINAYIKTGILENNLIGMEIGKSVDGTFKKFAQFVDEGVYLYDNSSSTEPAAKLTNNILIINNAVTNTLKIGGYVLDTSNGLAFKWGGN